MNVASSSGTKFKKVSKVDSGQDFDFSSLPVDVLGKIFSLLTSKEALNLCGSCKKLKNLSTLIPNVEIKEAVDGCPIKKQEFVESVSKFLANHAGLVKKFQLSFRPEEYRSDVLRWLSFIVKNGIEELDLTLYDRNYLEIPWPSLTAGTLQVLKLRHCKVDLPSIAGLKSLKSLLLEAMNISDDVMVLFCCHCESLQHLTLEKCSGFEEINIVDPRSKLETLILDGHCLSLSRLNISSLKTLVVRRRNMNFSFMNCPNIDHLVLSRVAAGGITQQESENMKANIINRLGNVRSLHLEDWAFECFAYQSIENHQFTNLEVLELDVNVCPDKLRELNHLLRQADSLKTLFISSIVKADYIGEYAINTARNMARACTYSFSSDKVKPTVGLSSSTAGASINVLQNVYMKTFKGTLKEVNLITFLLKNVSHLRVFSLTPVKEIDQHQCREYAKFFATFSRVSTNLHMVVGSEEVVWKAEEA